MKKIKLIIICLITLLIPGIIKADMAAPTLTKFKMIVINPNGIKVSDDVTIPYGAEVEATEVFYSNYFTKEKSFFFKYNGKDYYDIANVEDFKLVSDSIDGTKVEKNDSDETDIYIYKEGAYLYKGPAEVFGKVDENIEIPIGTELSSIYHDDLWWYVTYNGVSGWLYHNYGDSGAYLNLPDTVLIVVEHEYEYFIAEDLKLLKTVGKNIEIGNTIKEFTKINSSKLLHGDDDFIYTEYNGTKGYISVSNLIYEVNKDAYIFEDINIYTNRGDKESIVGTIPKNSEIKILYEPKITFTEEIWYYIEYEGQNFWTDLAKWYEYISIKDDSLYGYYGTINFITATNIIYNIEEESPIYSAINGKTTGIKLKTGAIYVKYITDEGEYNERTSWYYATDGTNTGWIKEADYIKSTTDQDQIIPGFTKYTLTSDMQIYDGIEGKITDQTINAGEVTILEVYEDETLKWWRVKNDEIEGWIVFTSKLIPATVYSEEYEISLDKKYVTYGYVASNIILRNVMSSGKVSVTKTIIIENKAWLYANDGKIENWIVMDLLQFEKLKDMTAKNDTNDFIEYPKEEKLSILEVLGIGIIIAIIVDLSFVVSMKYINKKKNIKINNEKTNHETNELENINKKEDTQIKEEE